MFQLYASVLMKDPVAVCKAKSLLEKALLQDESYLPAVYLLAEIHEKVCDLKFFFSFLVGLVVYWIWKNYI